MFGMTLSFYALQAILGMFDTFSEKDKFNKMCQLITKIIKLSVKGMLMFFLGLNGIKSLILPLSDSLKMSVLFKAVSMIPGIGNSAQTVSKTIAGSAVLVKNSIGVAAVIVMAVIIGIPLLKLVVMVTEVSETTMPSSAALLHWTDSPLQ